ncbi:MAG: hypothetical protein ACXW2G_13495, partial [Burkholderiaceae bacterium]
MTRIPLLFVRIAFALCVATSATTSAAQPNVENLRAAQDARLQAGLRAVVRDARLEQAVEQGHLALALVDATDATAPRLAMLNGDRMMYAASMPKVAIMLGALAEAEAGRL